MTRGIGDTAALPLRAVLFDLDGTLIDSAPDLAGAANEARNARGLPSLPLSSLRPMVGAGARGMVGLAFGIGPADSGYAELRDDFLQRYKARMTRDTVVFTTMLPVLDAIEAASLPWGIVTNKAARFAVPLVRSLRRLDRSQVLVCGDTTPHAKPHPAPLLEAAARLGVPPAQAVYVGDDLRDIQAGKAAGMRTVAAAWGYLGSGENVNDWGADHVVESPVDLLHWLHLP